MYTKAVLLTDTDSRMEGAGRSIYGFTLLERQLRMLDALGLRRVTVVGPSNEPALEELNERIAGFEKRWFESLHPVVCAGRDDDPKEWLLAQDESILVLDAHHLYDHRILSSVMSIDSNLRVVDGACSAPCRLLKTDCALFKELTKAWRGSDSFWSTLDCISQDRCAHFDIQCIDPYVVHLRRRLPLWWIILDSEVKASQAELFLMDAAQKGTLDFPAEFIHPPLENRLSKWISKGSITPNQVTSLTIVLAILATGLLAANHLVTGLLLAFIVGVLDGVDGKLARTTERCTKFGDRYEHILDVLYELTWYWAIGWMLSAGGSSLEPLLFSGVITVFYLLDKTATGWFKHRRGIELFDFEPVDRFFRRIGARRNINVLVLLAGALMGLISESFAVVTTWTVATAGFHWMRAIRGLSRSQPSLT